MEEAQSGVQAVNPDVQIVKSAAPGSLKDKEHQLRLLEMRSTSGMSAEEREAHKDRVLAAQTAIIIAKAAGASS